MEFVESMLLRANEVSWRARTDGCRGGYSETKILVSTGDHDHLAERRSKILVQKNRDVDLRTVQNPQKVKALNNEGGL